MSFDDPTTAERAFYTAFVDRDLDAMRRVWSHQPDAACLHPGGGLLVGVEAIMASWADIFRGASAPRIQVRPVQTRVDRDIAIHIVQEQIRSTDQDREATVVATNVYRRVGNGWLMWLHHASLPLIEPAQPRPKAKAALH